MRIYNAYVGRFRMRDTIEAIIGDIKTLVDEIAETKYPLRKKTLYGFRKTLREYIRKGEITNEKRAKLFAKVRSENGKMYRGKGIMFEPKRGLL